MTAGGRRSQFLEAAVMVLAEAGHPLTADEIVARALERRLIRTEGKTPAATMTACLYTHVRDAERPRVVRVFEPGKQRAQRGSVRWSIAPPAS